MCEKIKYSTFTGTPCMRTSNFYDWISNQHCIILNNNITLLVIDEAVLNRQTAWIEMVWAEHANCISWVNNAIVNAFIAIGVLLLLINSNRSHSIQKLILHNNKNKYYYSLKKTLQWKFCPVKNGSCTTWVRRSLVRPCVCHMCMQYRDSTFV